MLNLIKHLLALGCATFALFGCGRDDGRDNCISEAATAAVALQVEASFQDAPWLKGKTNVSISDVRTIRIDERIALAACEASLRVKPPKDVVDLLASRPASQLINANDFKFQQETRELVTLVSFEAQRTDDTKSMVVSKLQGHLQIAEGMRRLALRQALVVDEGSFLSPVEVARLTDELQRFRLKSGIPIYLITVKKLPNGPSNSIADFAKRRAAEWRLQDALLVVMSKDDRQIRLEAIGIVGERLSDQRAKSLIDDVFVPRFKAADFAGGLEAGLRSAITELCCGRRPIDPGCRL